MADFVQTGRVVDLILALVIIETLVLAIYWRRTGRGVAPVGLVLNNAAGVSLMLALRAALTGGTWLAITPWLIAALCAHLADLAHRWR